MVGDEITSTERKVILTYGGIVSGLLVAYFGFYVYPILYKWNPDFPLLFFVLPLLIIWILIVLRIYYWTQLYTSWFVDKQKPLRFWGFYIIGFVVGLIAFVYLTWFDAELKDFENSWIFSFLILTGIIFHSIYWILIYYNKS